MYSIYKTKSKYLNQSQVDIVLSEIKDADYNTTFEDNIEAKQSGLVPLIPIIAAICAGITALLTARGAAAGTIIGAKNFAETERHNIQVERIAEGNLFDNTEKKKVR